MSEEIIKELENRMKEIETIIRILTESFKGNVNPFLGDPQLE